MVEKTFTIVICTYNGGEKISGVIDRILDQGKTLEMVDKIVVVDNNSSDNTREIVSQYSENVPIVEYVFEGLSGLSNARRTGVNAVNTEWIIFLDDDNYITPHWLEHVLSYIGNNPKVGAFNGAVIPKLTFDGNEDYANRLVASYKVLACTHLDENELYNNPQTPFRNPIGAGMVVLTKPLKQLIDKGWLSASGRTKDNLASGEDGEMAFWIKNQGYEFGFCKDAILYHEIPQFRLEDEYLKKMWYEIGKGVAIVIKNQDRIGLIRYLYYIYKYTQYFFAKGDSYKKSNLYNYLNGYKNGL